jgi:hypothetical protein
MLSPNRAAIVTWEERIAQARLACEAWKQEAEESKIKATIASQQRDEVNLRLFICVYVKLKMSCFTGIDASYFLEYGIGKNEERPVFSCAEPTVRFKEFPDARVTIFACEIEKRLR